MIGMNLMKYMEKEICFCISARKFSSTISCMTGDTALLEVYVSRKLWIRIPNDNSENEFFFSEKPLSQVSKPFVQSSYQANVLKKVH